MGRVLLDKLDFYAEEGLLHDIPDFVYSNLRSDFTLRDYQKEALKRFITCFETETLKKPFMHSLFHMATGSGKTFLMAALILYLKSKGYSNFLFVVNSNNILEKTRNNFIDTESSKYLFAKNLHIYGRKVFINSVAKFGSIALDENINICLTTIQSLQKSFNTPKEDGLSLQSFKGKKTVILCDEAHHMNSDAKKGVLSEYGNSNFPSWESVLKSILNLSRDNIMLDFSATIDFNNEGIFNKYKNNTVIEYTLESFRNDKYSKEIQLLQTSSNNFEKTLLAIILSQYRWHIFQKNNISRVKPVILVKSKSIAANKAFFKEFYENIQNVDAFFLEDLLVRFSKGDSNFIIDKCLAYFKKDGLTFEYLLNSIKLDFCKEKSLRIDSKSGVSDIERECLNNLEEPSNKYRLIFAVNQLDEGWDVLNLFDIVKAYTTKVPKRKNMDNIEVSKSTISEAQLIGRGARYLPFQYLGYDKDKRKFDNNTEHELRICEELYFHSEDNPSYIDEIRGAFKKYNGGDITPKTKKIKVKAKKSFVDSAVYQDGVVFVNKPVFKGVEKKKRLDAKFTNTPRVVNVFKHKSSQYSIFDNENNTIDNSDVCKKTMKLTQLGTSILRKALMQFPVFEFNTLVKIFDNLRSLSEFISNKEFLGNVTIEIRSDVHYEKLSLDDKLSIAIEILTPISQSLLKHIGTHYTGGKFEPVSIKERMETDFIMHIVEEGDCGKGISQSHTNQLEYQLDLQKKDWYVFDDNYGSTEEKLFLKYFDSMYEQLSQNYEDIYVIRNEKNWWTIYSYENAKPFRPDFILLLKNRDNKGKDSYQIFVEPKGAPYYDEEKERFLKTINETIKSNVLFENESVRIIGLPFFNRDTLWKEGSFDDEFKKLI